MMQVDNINGLFEIHITVQVPHSFYLLWSYVSKNKDMKLILAISEHGKYKEQYMISKYKNGYYKDILQKAEFIKSDMEKNGIIVLRVKIESIAGNDGVPYDDEVYNQLIVNSVLVGKPYFEYHAKIDLMQHDIMDLSVICWNLNKDIKKEHPDVYVATSTNICGSKIPLLTLRIYNHGKSYATMVKNMIFDDIKRLKFKIIEGIQQEFSVYDTNDDVDRGWLI